MKHLSAISISSIAFFLLGVAYFKAQSFEIAEEDMNNAITLGIEGRYPQARLMLANLCIQQKRWQDAIDHLDIYLRENPYRSDRGKIKDMRKEIRENLKPAEK